MNNTRLERQMSYIEFDTKKYYIITDCMNSMNWQTRVIKIAENGKQCPDEYYKVYHTGQEDALNYHKTIINNFEILDKEQTRVSVF